MLLITVVWRSPPVLHSWPDLQGDLLATPSDVSICSQHGASTIAWP